MPNWKKLIVSGSDASLTNLQLTDLNPIEDDTVLVIDSSGNVGTKESAASSGTSGANGSSGTSGNSGSSGTSGNSGSSGTSGNSGSSGTSGNSGSSGTSGVDGDDGSDGSSGTSGNSGSSGTSGNSGSSGTSGNSGSSGTSGNSGSSGTSGNDGADGILPLSGNTANGVITYDGDGTGTVESTLTYNANQLNVSGGNSTQWNTSYGWGDHSIVGYVSSSGNTIIGTDADINTLGATIIDNLYMTDGVITSHGTRVLTKGDLELENVNNTTDLLKPISTATQTALNLKANLSSPTFTGTVIAPTPISNDSSTKVATTAYVQGEITDLIGGAGAAFDTLLEISASIANGDSDVVALTTTVSGKLQKDQNLSDLTNAGTARTNLGLGGLATLNTVNAATITDNSVGAAELNVVGNGTTTQFLRSDADGTFTWATPTDTNTQLTDTQVRSKFSAGTNVAISTAGVISSTDTNTTYAIGDGGLTTKNFTAALKTKLDALDSSTYLKSNANDTFSGYILGSNIFRTADGNTNSSLNPNGQITSVGTAANIIQIDAGNDRIRTFTGNATYIDLVWPTIASTSKTITFPDATGTIALTSNIPSGNQIIDWTTDQGSTNIHSGNYTNTTYGVATNTVLGLVELFNNTDQSVAANTVSTTAGRTYGLQLNSANQGVINVPWTDTNTQLTDTQVRSKFSAGTNVAISTAGVISSTDTNTTYAIGDGGLTTKDFTAALKTKLDALDSSTYLKSNADDSFSGGLVSTARDKGIFGTYDSTKTDHIWSMGTAYKNHASGTNFGNLYGLAYKHTNNTTGGTMAGGHQMVWASNGTPKSAMGDNIWTAGTVTATGGNSTQWNTAYNWGNHASAGYLTSYTDTNTTYSAGRGLDISGTEFQLETDLRDSISYIGYDSNDYIQWSNNGWTRTVVNGTERLRVDTAGIDVSGRAIIDTNLTVGVSNIVGSGAVLTGGSSNVNGGYLSTIAGGTLNLNCQHYGTIAGGYLNGLCTNYSGNGYSFIGAGACNIIKSGLWSAIVSGCNNKILTQGSIDGCQGNFIGGGNNNYIMANNRSSIVGGCQNNIYDQSHGSIIGGGHVNAINDSEKSIIGGGLANYIVNGYHQTIGGGAYNQISSPCETAGNTISGGECNQICQGYQSNHNTIAGGCNNQICTYYHGNNFIGGGNSNCIQASYGASNSIIGGYNNKVYSGCYSAIIGGSSISAYSSNYVYVPNLCNVGGGTSDCRLKESICNIPYGLSHVSQLEPVSYKFTSDESKATKYGFLAQCVQEIMPDLITNHPTALVDGTPVLQFDKDAIWSSMVNAIKDLKNEVDALKARIDILEA